MTATYDSNNSGFAAGTTGSPTGGLHLADPQFRFPVKPGTQQRSNSTENRSAGPGIQNIDVAGTPTQAHAHTAHGAVPAPHFQIESVEQYVGWSVQEVAWTGSVESIGRVAPPSAPSQIPAADKTSPKVELRNEPAEPDLPAESAQARPIVLPQPADEQVAVTHWPTSSRQQVSGFAIQRTRVDQPHALVTGASLAAEHRRWAARNLSGELQTRTVAEAGVPQAADSASTSSVADAGQIASRTSSSRLGGGLPLVVHPDFRWSSVVEKLCHEQALASQLNAAAEQLLQAGNGRLLLAGARRQQGTTTLAATISRMMIERGQRVLMVDADLARAGWTSELELTAAGSWVQQVESFGPLQEAMAISRRSNAAVVALQPLAARKKLPPFLLDYLGQLLQPLANQFDATVIDLGPISQMLEELSQPARLGSALLIVQQGGPDAALELRRAKTTLNAFGISRLAVAQNFASSAAG